MSGNVRDRERRVFERLVRLHPELQGGQLTEVDDDGLDGIIVAGNHRFGFQLTNIYPQGTTDAAGSTAIRAEREWDDLGPKLQDALNAVPGLNCAVVAIWFRLRDGAHLHPDDLPRKRERDQFVREFAAYLAEVAPERDAGAASAHDLRPLHGSLLHKYIRSIGVSWRLESTPPTVKVVGLRDWTRMGSDVLDLAFQRKRDALTHARLSAVRDKYELSEVYLVLGGDPEARAHARQIVGDYLFVLHSLTHMRVVLDDSFGVDGIIVFHDGGDQISVFCAACVRNHQALHNWRAGEMGLSVTRHRCSSLTRRGPIAKNSSGEVAEDDLSVDLADESSWIIA